MAPQDSRDHLTYLVTLGLDANSFMQLQSWRERYLPPTRNIVPPHITLFHKLTPSETIPDLLRTTARRFGKIKIRFAELERFSRGFCIRVESPLLARLRGILARELYPTLTAQDRIPFRPHVTLLNKTSRAEAEAALVRLQAEWTPWDGKGTGLLLFRYCGGPWEPVAEYPFKPSRKK